MPFPVSVIHSRGGWLVRHRNIQVLFGYWENGGGEANIRGMPSQAIRGEQ